MNRRELIKAGLLTPALLRKESEDWISVKDALPEDGTYVFAIHNRGTWKDRDEKVNCVVVKFERGISEEERRQMPDCYRKRQHRPCDEGMNNKKPYCWNCFGPDCFFGQSITHWKPIIMPEVA